MGLLRKLVGKLFGIEGYQIVIRTVESDGKYVHKVSKTVYSNPQNDNFEKLIEIAERNSEAFLRDYALSQPYNPDSTEFVPIEFIRTITK